MDQWPPDAEQCSLFSAEELGRPGEAGGGYRGPTACAIVGITYRQLDYWARTKLVVPSLRGASGSGSQRLYSFKDVLVLKVVKRLLDAGVSLYNIRGAVDHLRARGVSDLAGVTLFSDGVTVYECSAADEIVDLLRGGQGVFGIAVGGAIREIAGVIAAFPRENVPGQLIALPPRAATPEVETERQRSALRAVPSSA
jgi:DNA-binding transcriptional MerR regulator